MTRFLAALMLAAVPIVVSAQDSSKKSDDKALVEVTGCIKGSMLTETNLRVSPASETAGDPKRRWRIRGPKALMKQIKQQEGQEMTISGTSKRLQSGMVISGGRIGNTRVMIGGAPGARREDPLPEQPTIDVDGFKLTGERCQ